jgi:hypothetical protein
MKRLLYLFSLVIFFGIIAVHLNVNSASANDSQVRQILKPLEKKTVDGSKSKSLCQGNRSMKQTPPPQDGNTDTQRPKNCRCLGRRSDGPLEGLCVIPCSCPGNCNKSD